MKEMCKKFAVEVMLKPLPKVLLGSALAYEAGVIGCAALTILLAIVGSKIKKE